MPESKSRALHLDQVLGGDERATKKRRIRRDHGETRAQHMERLWGKIRAATKTSCQNGSNMSTRTGTWDQSSHWMMTTGKTTQAVMKTVEVRKAVMINGMPGQRKTGCQVIKNRVTKTTSRKMSMKTGSTIGMIKFGKIGE
ncbi:hypothetical protein ACA910_006613 [Epithemia clementina (nom. ined.)]